MRFTLGDESGSLWVVVYGSLKIMLWEVSAQQDHELRLVLAAEDLVEAAQRWRIDLKRFKQPNRLRQLQTRDVPLCARCALQ